MREVMKCVSHQQASQLLCNKFVVVLGDSIQRAVYKDLVLLLQKEQFLSSKQLRSKGEMSFEQDCLVEGGCLGQMHNGTGYREVRQFKSDHHLVRFYFVTCIYSSYMKSVLEDLRKGLKPDVVIMNSCVWDISRYSHEWVDDYKENLHKFFTELKEILPENTLVMWNLTMPLGKRIIGGFLVPEIEHKSAHLRYDVVEANFYSGTLANAYGMDVLDLHYQFRFSLRHRMKDGVHWNAIAHRRITSLVLQHVAQAWGVIMVCPQITLEHVLPLQVPDISSKNAARASGYSGNSYPPPANYFSSNTELCLSKSGYNSGFDKEFSRDYLPTSEKALQGYTSFEENVHPNTKQDNRVQRERHGRGQVRNGAGYTSSHRFQPYPAPSGHHQYMTRTRCSNLHYPPYSYHRPRQHSARRHYY
ncbi:PC-esterase domain-containing protein 1A-like [Myripristis murdjan]|uniref:Family with sequence similarity 113 n=1 Tax=Myripristis murdjan TaxID=586833 RepID=A0A667WMP8_9TELE|nr:PC-esterase domain-containing protein 1A-like [Myripristis murdjan]